MRISRSSGLLVSALMLILASTALAAAPRPFILGSGGSPSFDDYIPNVMNMSVCPGPIATGWGVFGTSGWLVNQQFVPTITDAPLGIVVGASANGFTSCTLMATLYTDAGGGVPGSFITSTVPIPVNNLPAYPAAVPVKMRFGGGVTLFGGTSYIVVIEAPTNACFVVGNGTNACTGVGYQSLNFGSTWSSLGVDICHKLVGL